MKFPILKGLEIKLQVTESGVPFWSASSNGSGIVLTDEMTNEVSRLFGYLFYSHKLDDFIEVMLNEPYIVDSPE